ncbi:BRO1-like domain-containing protein [Mrakia frigida]|uniref:Rim20p n=1 Tax=Mrakia frigida TaxID=29902 RepID=UPI003FCC1110
MNNHLLLPFKKTAPLPSLPGALRTYISEHFKTIGPEAFKDDIHQFVRLRRDAVEGGIENHRENIGRLIKYHATLAYLLSKLPPDINQVFPYDPTFPPTYALHTPAPLPLPTLAHERFVVLYNLAACFSNLGALEPRTTPDSIKRATAAFQNSSGIFTHLFTLLPSLPKGSLEPFGSAAFDFKEGYIETMKSLTEAMAQECFWQQAVHDKYKNGTVARLAMKVSELYDQTLVASQKEFPSTASHLPPAWTALITIKKFHFSAAAQYRMSVEDLEKNRYGLEIARLEVAQGLAKKALDNAKRGIVSDLVIADIKTLSSTLTSSLARAKKDNDLIYLDLVPPAGELASVQGALMVKPVLPKEVEDSLGWLIREGGGLGWEGLVDYGVHVAISVYDDRKESFVRDEIVGKKEEVDEIAASTLQSLNLPGALQAVERPMGLPPSLLGMAEEVRRERGPERVRKMMDNIKSSRRQADVLLNEALDVLDQEAEEDEALRARYESASPSGLRWTRPASHEVNKHLTQQAETFRSTLNQAAASDGVVREKWEQWEDQIEVLGGNEDALSNSVPRLPTGPSLSSTPLTRLLHTLLESLSDLSNARTQIASTAKGLASRDDVRSLVISEANSIQRDAGAGEVRAEWFEGLFERELRKYESAREEMEGNGREVEVVLEEIRVQNEAFLASRRTSPTIKARENALQDLDLAYHRYREVVLNLTEGVKFYNDLLTLLTGYKNDCKEWVWSRRSDVS